jgi:hypothetical protein
MLSRAKECLEQEEAHCTDKGKPHQACSYLWVDVVSSNLLEDSNMEDCCHRRRSNDTCLTFLCQYAVKIHIGNTDSNQFDDAEYDGEPYAVDDQAIRWAVLYK